MEDLLVLGQVLAWLALRLFLAWFLFWKVPRAFFIGRKEGKERDTSSGKSAAYRLGKRLRRSRRD